MKRISLLALFSLLCLAQVAQADVYRCVAGRKVPVYANIACGPDAERLDLPGIPVMVRDPDEPAPARRGKSRTGAPRPVASTTADAALIEAWAKASQERLPPSLGGKPTKPATGSSRRQPIGPPIEDACSKARQTLSQAEQRAWEAGKRIAFNESRRLNDAIYEACY